MTSRWAQKEALITAGLFIIVTAWQIWRNDATYNPFMAPETVMSVLITIGLLVIAATVRNRNRAPIGMLVALGLWMVSEGICLGCILTATQVYKVDLFNLAGFWELGIFLILPVIATCLWCYYMRKIGVAGMPDTADSSVAATPGSAGA